MQRTHIKPDVLYANGDSWTYGFPLNEKTRNETNFISLLSKEYNLPVVNSAKVGGSNQRILRTTLRDVARLKQEGKNPFVFIGWTQLTRFELFDSKVNKWINLQVSDSSELKFAREVWARYSTDKSDMINFITQVILLDSFFKANNIPYFATTVFNIQTNLLLEEDMKNYAEALFEYVDIDYHMYKLSLSQLLSPYVNIKMDKLHPLEDGHKIIADFLKTQIDIRFQINNSK